MTSMALLTAISCGKVNTENALPLPDESTEVVETLQGLEVTPKSTYLVIGDTDKLEVVFSPDNVGDLKVTWASENPDVASVDANGTVTAIAKGLARITATSESKTATAIVNVVGERVPATGIVLNKTEISTLVGRYSKIKAALEPENTTDKVAIEWSTSNAQIASVESGVVIALALGEVTITAKQGDITASCQVTISDKIKLQDRSSAWIITDTPKWDKNWSGQITGSHVDVALAGCDADYHYFQVVSADKGVDIEAISNDIYMQVEEKKDAGQSPANLFATGETQTISYKDLGNAIAYVLGFDEEFEFTGEYATYEFEAKEPDPVHATGIKFLQGSYGATEISELEIKEGKNAVLQLRFTPDDCTDTGTITLESADESVMTVAAYYPQYYSNYYQVTAVAPGETTLTAKYNDLEVSLSVKVTGSNITWTDRKGEWAFSFQEPTNSWYKGVFRLESCSQPKHLIRVLNKASADPANFKQYASEYEDYLQWYASANIPHNQNLSYDSCYIFVYGVSSNNEFTGDYMIVSFPEDGNTDPIDVTGIELDKTSAEIQEGQTVTLTAKLLPENQNQNPTIEWSSDNTAVATVAGGVVTAVAEGTANITASAAGFSASCAVTVTAAQTSDGKRVKFSSSGQYIKVDFNNSDATQSEVTIEGWICPNPASGGNDNIRGIFGVEGILNLRFESGKLQLVYSKDSGEKKATDNATYTSGVWHHVAATYKKGDKAVLYVDGNEIGSITGVDKDIQLNGDGSQWELPFTFIIGACAQPTRCFSGSMYEVRVWKTARTQSEIKDNMKKNLSNGTGLLASWTFSNGSGNSITDATGSYNITSNGTLEWENGTLPF